ncbi:MAG: energy transducer TonB [Pseudomonadota bacterium]|nr:energy transducer TonB [Pseudomonadota bacterium]MDE3038669.1 energy transducer TonB [Pseudomonadota bacterium]
MWSNAKEKGLRAARAAFAALCLPRWAAFGATGNVPSDWLDGRYFVFTIAAAALLHLTVLYAWYLMPHMQVVEIPVRALDIKLGNGDMTPGKPQAAQSAANNNHAVENAISHMAPAKEKNAVGRGRTTKNTSKDRSAPVSHSRAKVVGKFNVRAEKTAVAAPVMPVVAHQFVRELSAPAKGTAAGGNQAGKATALSYEQAISLWIQKFKVYPETARAEGMQGETVVRIRIDRQGNIGYYILEHSTGYAVLDHAAIDMIKRANPVPSVPAGYKGDTFEFLIPVSFHLQ